MSFYRHHVFFCVNERPDGHPRGCCAAKNSLALRNYMKARVKELGLEGVRINTAGCLDRCELGPVMVIYPDNVWYSFQDKDDIEELIRSHLQQGTPVERLRLADHT